MVALAVPLVLIPLAGTRELTGPLAAMGQDLLVLAQEVRDGPLQDLLSRYSAP